MGDPHQGLAQAKGAHAADVNTLTDVVHLLARTLTRLEDSGRSLRDTAAQLGESCRVVGAGEFMLHANSVVTRPYSEVIGAIQTLVGEINN